jgi:hypothetical protein
MVRRLSMTIVVIILLSGFLAGPAAAAEDKSCWLEAEQTVYLSIYDLDSMGSILAHFGKACWTRAAKNAL